MRLGEQENKQKRPVPFFRLAKKKKRSILNLCSVNGLMSFIFSSALLQHLTVKGETKMRYTGTYNMFMLNILVHMQDNDCGNFPHSSSYD